MSNTAVPPSVCLSHGPFAGSSCPSCATSVRRHGTWDGTPSPERQLVLSPGVVRQIEEALEEIAEWWEDDVNGEYTTMRPIDGFRASEIARRALALLRGETPWPS